MLLPMIRRAACLFWRSWPFSSAARSTCCATVLIGTLYPLALEAVTGEKISVGPPFFNATFVPLFVPLFALMPIGQTLAWKRGDLLGAVQRLVVAILCGLAALVVFAVWRGGPAVS